MEEMRRVVVVGGASDTETVLKAVFEPRGARVERTRRASRLARISHSEVLVIDLDAEHDSQPGQQVSRVLIGSRTPQSMTASERFLAKPFQYPELVKAIEELLDRPAA